MRIATAIVGLMLIISGSLCLGVKVQRDFGASRIVKVQEWPPPACWKTADVILLRCMSDKEAQSFDLRAGDEWRFRPGVHDFTMDKPIHQHMAGAGKPYGLIAKEPQH